MSNKQWKLTPRNLTKKCNPSVFNFDSTADVQPLEGIIGQDRAVRSLGFGLDLDHEGYNIYLSGPFGTGKSTLARFMLEKAAKKKKVPSDWVYVNNFHDPESPCVLKLPPGMGNLFRQDINSQIEAMIKQIIKTLEGEEYESKKAAELNRLMEEANNLYVKVEEEARSYGFTISRVQNSVTSIPLKDGEPLSQEDYMNMSDEERTELMRRGTVVQERINEAMRQYKEMEKNTRERIKQAEKEMAEEVCQPYFKKLLDKYGKYNQVQLYLEEMKEDVLSNLNIFIGEEVSSPLQIFRQMDKKNFLRRYQVNLLVDNADLSCAPVIFENHPTYANLFGQIEYESEFGVLSTDFTKIKGGALHRANGGYLVLHMYDLIKNFYVWDTLKRVLKNQEIVVESLAKNLGLMNTETLQPQPIPVQVKVILIGEPIYYYLLYLQDEEFQKLFKLKVDFDVEMDRTPRHIKEYARFVSSVCVHEGLRHFRPEAVARVVDYGSRMADDQNKLSTLFNRLVEIIYEANAWAGKAGKELVDAEDVERAVEEKHYRAAMLEEKMQEQFARETIMLDVQGAKIGQINGLAVYELGNHTLGKPIRITAKTFMGEKGVINIERETHMSGNIHSKGILILNGYMGSQYAQDKPLTLSALVTLEQSYGGIEGDSASSTELYAILSSLAEVPIKQGIAVTGSINQNGEIQPVGGINYKIEGFYKVCKQKGLTGEQGVIIPRQNISQLMLDEEIIEAVRKKKFSIWAISHIDEGLEILTGLKAGEPDKAGRFPEGSIHYLVDQKLRCWNARRIPGEKNNAVPANVLRRRRRR
ncbi:MAG TPA: AAA family ATPase [Syntrophomonadaceae bacterium]|nr:AAA family ATPase [Syntrophomonadaceae bacterium]